ncbi:DUF1109 family protein [bacterium]|jgi:hypothetical protein|nr:DUF1109 family protein [bacterium]
METTKLIHSLSKNLKPVRRLMSPIKRAIIWFVISILCVSIGVYWSGILQKFTPESANTFFILESIAILCFTFSASCLAFLLSVPGRFKSNMIWYTLVPLISWIILLIIQSGAFFSIFSVDLLSSTPGGMCPRDLATLCVVPALIIFSMIRLASPQKKSLIGYIGLLSSFGLAAFGLQFTCGALSSPLHVLMFHVSPAVGLALLGIFLGKILIK